MSRLSRLGVIAVCAISAVVGTGAIVVSDWWPEGNTYDRIATVVIVIGMWTSLVGTVWLERWRPASRMWRWLAALTVLWSLWAACVTSSATWAVLLNPAWLLRPVLFVAVLAWPTGRLRLGDRRWLAVYAVAQAATFELALLFTPTLTNDAENPIALVDAPRVATLLTSFGSSVVLPVGAVLLAGSMIRRSQRMTTDGRRFLTPAVAAAAITALSELILVASDYFGDLAFPEDGPTALGGFVLVANFLPYTAVPVCLVIAAERSRVLSSAERVRHIEVGPSALALPDAVAAALGDPSAVVAYRRPDGTWVDSAGGEVTLGGSDRAATFVERDGERIAAIEHSSTIDQPITVELAVAAAGSTIEFERTKAIANARRSEASEARRVIVEAQDAARQRLERDLHDGAQQRLVGLALQANLAARGRAADRPDDVAEELRLGIDATRDELSAVAAGVLPALLAKRGLSASLATLAAATPMTIELAIRQPGQLAPDVAAAAWFVVSEAVANATKHSGATKLSITGGVADGRLDVRISDDGRGGAHDSGSGLTGLRERVARSGGVLTLDSPLGRGTVVHASFPLSRVT